MEIGPAANEGEGVAGGRSRRSLGLGLQALREIRPEPRCIYRLQFTGARNANASAYVGWDDPKI